MDSKPFDSEDLEDNLLYLRHNLALKHNFKVIDFYWTRYEDGGLCVSAWLELAGKREKFSTLVNKLEPKELVLARLAAFAKNNFVTGDTKSERDARRSVGD